MNVSELRARLGRLPDDMPVILEKDAEGNGYSPLESLFTGRRYAQISGAREGIGRTVDDSNCECECKCACPCGGENWHPLLGMDDPCPCTHEDECPWYWGVPCVILGPLN